MPRTARDARLESLQDLTRIIQTAEGFHPLVAALKNGRAASVDGAWGSSASLVVAGLGRHAPGTMLVVLAHPSDVDGWADDLAGFAGTRPVLFPAWDNLPGDSAAADEVAGQRLRLLKPLEGPEPPPIILTTVQALIQPVPGREELAKNRRRFAKGEQVDPEELALWLVDHGFERADTVVLPGTFTRRGGILDVFPIDAEAPFRVEFFGDEVESIRQFSPQTQRSLNDLESAELTGFAGSVSPASVGAS